MAGIAIPATEPGSAQLSLTISSSTIAQFSSSTGVLCASGTNLTAYNRMLVYKVFKNGSAILSGAQNCQALKTWEFKVRSLTSIAVNDVISIKLWTGNAAWLEMNSDYVSDGSSNFATIRQAVAYAIALG